MNKQFNAVNSLKINESEGKSFIDNRRILLLDAANFRQLWKRLTEQQSRLEGAQFIWNWGYANGFQDAIAVKKYFSENEKLNWFKAGIDLLNLRGFTHLTKISGSLDKTPDGESLLELEWENSWEIENILKDEEPSDLQNCNTIIGYLSGFLSAVMDENILFIETKCRGRGDECCYSVAKKNWKDDDEAILAIEKLANEITGEEIKFNELVAENEPVTTRIRKLIREIEAQKIEIETLQTQVQYLQEVGSGEKPIHEMIGTSIIYKKALRTAEKVAKTDSTILIQGETGTGKELFARYIYANSHLKNRPLITVNCAALPTSLVESELFGHEKGAFTGAVQRKLGRFEVANGGTIFLDEIGELPLETQAKFLRILQEGEFERVGGNFTIKVKVRVLAATNRNLEELVEEGKFRADLFYRLNVFPVTIPSLRERGNDVVLLTNYFAQKFRKRFQKPITSVSKVSLENLKEYGFPGNIRELQHLVERAVLLSEGDVLHIELPSAKKLPNYANDDDSLVPLDEMERRYIQTVLQKTNGAIAGKGGAAEILDLPPSTLRSRMKKLGIK